MRRSKDLKPWALRDVVQCVQEILYWDVDRNCFDPDKEWDVEMLDRIAEQLHRHKLVPEKKEL